MSNVEIDVANARFWDELCGTSLAKALGATGRSMEDLRTFDRGYMDLYPYLLDRVPAATMRGKKVLEIGLGYGTLGQKIAEAGADYTGLDIAQGPVDMMNHRLKMQGLPGKAIQSSMLQCPLPDQSVDCVVSIGCFHHTGNVRRCVDETWRVLKPGGRAYLMVYNRFSYFRWIKWFGPTLRAALASNAGSAGTATESERWAYDSNAAGGAAPETVFLSRNQLRGMLSRFTRASLVLENCNPLSLRGLVLVSRPVLLPVLGPIAGLDIYISAEK